MDARASSTFHYVRLSILSGTPTTAAGARRGGGERAPVHGTPGATHPTRTAAAEEERGAVAP